MPPDAATLEPIVRWALEADATIEVIAQDEYTLDVIVGVEGRYWVYDTT